MEPAGKSGIDKQLHESSTTRWSVASMATFVGSVLLVVGIWAFGGRSGPAAAEAAPLQFVREKPAALAADATTQRCDACHAFDAGFSHPTGVIPTMAVPGELPLTDGRMTCLTCHTDEAGQPHATSRRSQTAMLRESRSPAGLCSSCHQPGAGTQRGFHGSDLVRAHLQPASWTPAPSGSMDAESQSCVACHDGSLAKDAGGHGIGGSTLGSSGDHPIAVDYRSRPATRDSDEIRFVSLGALDRRVRLFDRTVGCGSCHSVYSKRQDLLVMPNVRSALCLSCHSL
jgi:predicted CXXCH cytochrome family protein